MWPFRRSPQNRRRERSAILRTRVRADIARARTAQRLLRSGLLLFVTALGVYALWRGGEWALNRLFFEHDSFALRTIEVQTDGALSRDQVILWANVKPGQNLLALDLARIKRELEQKPWIRLASLERVLPQTLRLRVSEREPLAEAQVPRMKPGGQVEMDSLLLDEEGMVMPPLDPRQRARPVPQPPPRYPLLAGLEAADLVPGRKLTAPQVRAAMELVAAFDESPMLGLDGLQRIELASPDTLQVTTLLGSQLTFSTQDLPRQLRRWRAIFDLGRGYQRHIAALDLALSNNIPARWLESSAVPPLPPEATRPVRARKRHV